MKYGIVFLPPATKDMRAAHDWYEEREPGLGKEFLQYVLAQFEKLNYDLMDHRFYIEPVRYVKLKKFPYSIFYIKNERQRKITITAVLSNKQDMLNIIRARL